MHGGLRVSFYANRPGSTTSTGGTALLLLGYGMEEITVKAGAKNEAADI